MRRREFLKKAATGSALAPVLSISMVDTTQAENALPDVVWVENGEPHDLLKNALQSLGGIGKFVEKGDIVVVKPNIAWDKEPQFAATTNPELVAEIVKSCIDAGAKKVKVFDRTCNNPLRCYRNTQIEKLADEAGAEVIQLRDSRYKMLSINGKLIAEWPIYKDYLEADKVINVPVAKHHSLSQVTLGLKNLMGVMGGERGDIHKKFPIKLADINKKLLPTLTIIDAYRILTSGGPVGGNLANVKNTKTLVASPCTVSADYVALELFGLPLHKVEHIKYAAENGLARYDLNKINLKRITLS